MSHTIPPPTLTEPMLDGRVHRAVVSGFVKQGFSPSAHAIATSLGVPDASIEASLRRLHEEHALVLHPASTEVWIAHPFVASPTTVFVEAGARGWWAPCAWCAMGVVALAAETCTVHARIGGEAEPIAIPIEGGELCMDGLLVHFAIPPRLAWDNVVHWCATVQPFRRAEDAAAWAERHRLPHGEAVPLAKVLALGKRWYGGHLDASFRKHTVAEARAIFEEVGLRGPFWELPPAEGRF